MYRRTEIEMGHHLNEGGLVAILQTRICDQFVADCGTRAAFVFVGREDHGLWIQGQQTIEQTVE